VYAPDVGIVLPNGNVRSPDVTFVSTAKLPGGVSPETFGEVIPDLAVEVLSPSDSMTQIGRKIGEYFENGVPLVWLVEPRKQTVTIYRSLTDTEQRTIDDTITAEPILRFFGSSAAVLLEGLVWRHEAQLESASNAECGHLPRVSRE
jgi:Uma2 family endonuclease